MRVSTPTTDGIVRQGSRLRRFGAAVVATVTVAAAAVVTALPAAASVTTAGGTVSAGTFVVTGGALNSVDPGDGTTIVTAGPRTILDFSGFVLPTGADLNIVVSSASDVVLIRVAPGTAAQVDGFLRVTVGRAMPASPVSAPPTNAGGNLWFSAPTGVTFGGVSRVWTGGLLATTAGPVADSDFLGGQTTLHFVGGAASVNQQVGSVITGHGGHVAMVSDSVTQTGTIADPGSDTDVLLGGARSFTLGLGQELASTQALLAFSIPPSAGSFHGPSTAAIPLSVSGSVDGANVYLVSDSTHPSAVGPVVEGSATAGGAVPDRNGSLVLVSGGGISRTALGSFAVATQRPGALPQPIRVLAPLDGAYQTVVAASGDLTISSGGSLAAQEVILSTGGDLVNSVGNGAVSASNRWLVYAPTPADVPDPGLDSGAQAYWGSAIDTRPPASVPGGTQSRYLFAQSRTLTFTATDDTKDFGEVPVLSWTDDFATVAHPGVTGLFAADTRGWAVSGDPAISSTGQPASAKVPLVGYHPIDVGQGASQSSPGGYDLAFEDGKLWVLDTTAPQIGVVATGTLVNGWYTDDVAVDWTVVEDESETAETGCSDFDITADQAATDYTCVVDTFHFPGTSLTLQDVQRDDTNPDVTAAGSVGSSGITEGMWTNQDVLVDFSCTDRLSGEDQLTADVTVTSAQLVNGQCTDVAGNTDAVAYQVNIDKVAPTVGAVTAGSSGQPYSAGTWVDQDVTVSWTCADTGGSGVVLGTDSVTRTTSGTVTPRCRDNAGTETSGSPFRVNIIRGYGVAFDRPVDPSPVVNVAKLGRVVPVKAAVTAYDLPVTGSSTEPISLGVTPVSCVTGTADGVETYAAAGSGNTGNLFRWDAGSSRWVYNLDTGRLGLTAGSCARVDVYYGGEVVGGIASGGFPVGGFLLRVQR